MTDSHPLSELHDTMSPEAQKLADEKTKELAQRLDRLDKMNKLVAWGMHAAVAALTALIVTGGIYDLVPAGHQREAITVIPALAYLLGVKLPTPGGKPQ